MSSLPHKNSNIGKYVLKNKDGYYAPNEPTGTTKLVEKAKTFKSVKKARDMAKTLGGSWKVLKKITSLIEVSEEKDKLKAAIITDVVQIISYSWKKGSHALTVGFIQSGKWLALADCNHQSQEANYTTFVLFRNNKTDLKQHLRRLGRYNKKLIKAGRVPLEEPLELVIGNREQSMKWLAKAIDTAPGNKPTTFLGLANKPTIKFLLDFYKNYSKYKGKGNLIIDEGDCVVFELEKKFQTGAEKEMEELFDHLNSIVSFTATPLSILLCDKIDQVNVITTPPDYYGIDKVTHMPTNGVRTPGPGAQYDPARDPCLKTVLSHFYASGTESGKTIKPMMLISTTLIKQEHKSIVDHIMSSIDNSKSKTVVLEFNENSVKAHIYGQEVKTYQEGKNSHKYGDIAKVIQIYKDFDYIIIVAGKHASRGISFVSADYSRHLTHQYIVASNTSHLETLVQQLRLLGIYKDKPELFLFCTTEIYEQCKANIESMTKFIDIKEKSIKNGTPMPEVIPLLRDFSRDLLAKRKELGQKQYVITTSGSTSKVHNLPIFTVTIHDKSELPRLEAEEIKYREDHKDAFLNFLKEEHKGWDQTKLLTFWKKRITFVVRHVAKNKKKPINDVLNALTEGKKITANELEWTGILAGGFPGEVIFDMPDSTEDLGKLSREARDAYEKTITLFPDTIGKIICFKLKEVPSVNGGFSSTTTLVNLTKWDNGTTPTTQIGYVNRNNQRCEGHRGEAGTDHGAFAYRMICQELGCGHEYGSNGTDIFQRLCPKCQGGQPGISY